MSELVRKTLAECALTPARKRKLAELAARPDSEIDFSDIPPLPESFWNNAVRNPFYRPVKQQLSVIHEAAIASKVDAAVPGSYDFIEMPLPPKRRRKV
jgi:hypothetical protein